MVWLSPPNLAKEPVKVTKIDIAPEIKEEGQQPVLAETAPVVPETKPDPVKSAPAKPPRNARYYALHFGLECRLKLKASPP